MNTCVKATFHIRKQKIPFYLSETPRDGKKVIFIILSEQVDTLCFIDPIVHNAIEGRFSLMVFCITNFEYVNGFFDIVRTKCKPDIMIVVSQGDGRNHAKFLANKKQNKIDALIFDSCYGDKVGNIPTLNTLFFSNYESEIENFIRLIIDS